MGISSGGSIGCEYRAGLIMEQIPKAVASSKYHANVNKSSTHGISMSSRRSAAVLCSTAAVLTATVILVITVFWKSIAPDSDHIIPSFSNQPTNGDIAIEPAVLVQPYLMSNTSLELDASDQRQWRFRRKHVSLSSVMGEDEGLFNCDSLVSLGRDAHYSASGWTKAVYQAKRGQQAFAVKLIDPNAVHMQECLQVQPLQICYAQAAIKLLKEVALLHELQNGNLIKLRGYCIPARPLDVPQPGAIQLAIITDWATPVQLINLLQMDWESRLQILSSVSQLLVYLSRTPFGSLGVTDFRLQQFVLQPMNAGIQLVDIDDVAMLQPTCRTTADCSRVELAIKGSECIKSVCMDYNQRLNIAHAYRIFFADLLLPDVPLKLWPDAIALLHDLKSGSLDAVELDHYTNQLALGYSTLPAVDKKTLQDAQTKVYNIISNTSLPRGGAGSFSCEGSRLPSACELTVTSVAEARALCASNTHCQAVALSSQRSWTGRLIVELKTSVAGIFDSPGSVVYRIRS